MKKRVQLLALMIGTVGPAASTHAHPGHDVLPSFEFAGGWTHPFSGWDHVLAALAVGIWAGRLGGRARLAVPAAFVAGMVLGLGLRHAGLVVPAIQQGIAVWAVGLGLLIVNSQRSSDAFGACLMLVLAVFHGAAHGAIAEANALPYFGLIVGTAMLHMAGLSLAELKSSRFSTAKRCFAWTVAAVGFAAWRQAEEPIGRRYPPPEISA